MSKAQRRKSGGGKTSSKAKEAGGDIIDDDEVKVIDKKKSIEVVATKASPSASPSKAIVRSSGGGGAATSSASPKKGKPSTSTSKSSNSNRSKEDRTIAYDPECWDELLREYWVQGTDTPEDEAEKKEKQDERKKSDPDKPERKHPDSWQMNFWNKYFGWLLFGKGPIGKAIGFIFVTPLTNVTGLSLYYQLYLNEIFHTRFMTRLGHFTFMPIIDFFLIAFLCQFRAPFWDPYPLSGLPVELFLWNLGVVAAIWLVVWYLVWGLTQRTYLFGVWMIPSMAAMAIGANVYYTYFRWNDGLEHPWYEPTPLAANPLLWMVIGGMGQSGSHAFEPNIPPRVNHTAHWIPLKDFVSNGIKNHKTLLVIWTVFAAFTFGIMDEIVASPRLLPLNMLKIVYMLGYKPDQWKQIQKLAKWSMEYGNPALDFIGRGGALRPPSTYEEAKEKFAKYDHLLTDKEKQAALDIQEIDSSKLGQKKYRQEVKYKLLKLLISQAKLQKYAFGPFVGGNRAGKNVVKKLEKKKAERNGEGAFHAFLSQAREDLWTIEQARRSERVKSKSKKFTAPPTGKAKSK